MLEVLKKMKLSTKVAIAMVAGGILGIMIGPSAQHLKFIGDIWLNLIKMILVPMVLLLLIKGVSSMDNAKTLGRIGLKIASFYMFTTVFAATIGIIVAKVFKPGIGFKFEKATEAFETAKVLSFKEYITNLFSSNMFVSFYNGDMVQILVIAIIFGIALISMDDKLKTPIRNWVVNTAELCTSVVKLLMELSPIGVFCLMASSLGTYGLEMLSNMGKLLGTFYLASLLQVLLIYLVLLWIIGRVSPIDFMRKSIQTWVTAISTCSSVAVIPVNLKVATEEFDVSEHISSFSIPLGANFNQDGGAILSAVVILFSAQAIGIEFGFMTLVQIVLISTLVSAGSGGIPGGGIVRLMVTSAAFGMPLEIVALIAGFYRFFDMGTTSMSVIGDLSATVLIDRVEKRRASGGE